MIEQKKSKLSFVYLPMENTSTKDTLPVWPIRIEQRQGWIILGITGLIEGMRNSGKI